MKKFVVRTVSETTKTSLSTYPTRRLFSQCLGKVEGFEELLICRIMPNRLRGRPLRDLPGQGAPISLRLLLSPLLLRRSPRYLRLHPLFRLHRLRLSLFSSEVSIYALS